MFDTFRRITIVAEELLKGQHFIMAGIKDLQAAQAAEKADLAALAGLVNQLLVAFANQTLSPADAQALLDEMNTEDATVKTNIASITAALPPPATT